MNNAPLHILYFHQHFSTPAGSTGTRSYEFAKRLIASGHSVTMICGSCQVGKAGLSGPFKYGKREGMVEGIRIIEFKIPYSNYDNFLKRAFLFFIYAFRSVFIALFEKYNLLFATSTPLTAGIPGIVARWIRRKPFVFEIRDLWPDAPRSMGVIKNPFILKAIEFLEWATCHSAVACIGLSPGIVEGIRRLIPEGEITLIPNSCDLDLFKPHEKKTLNLRGIRPQDFTAVYCGAHGVANGLNAVLDTAGVLKKRNRDEIKIIFIGNGKLKPHLVKQAEHDGLDNCLFYESLPKNKLAEVLGAANVGLMIFANVPAFYYGTSPNKFFDYISSGLPVLVNYPGWMADIVQQYRCGIAVPPEEPIKFANALIALSEDREMALEMGRRSRKLAEKKFNRDVLAAQFVQFLEKIAKTE